MDGHNKWHVERRIDMSMILSALFVVCSVFGWGFSMNVHINSLAKDIQETRAYVFKLEDRLKENMYKLEERLTP